MNRANKSEVGPKLVLDILKFGAQMWLYAYEMDRSTVNSWTP